MNKVKSEFKSMVVNNQILLLWLRLN